VMRPLLASQHSFHATDVGWVNQVGSTQLTLTLGSHLREDVALVSVLVLEAGSGLLETLFRPAMGFHFWHVEYSAFG